MKRALLLLAIAACGHPAPPVPIAPLPPLTPDAAPTPDASADAIVPVDGARLETQLTPYLESFGKKLGVTRSFSGFVLVAQHGNPVYARGFGYADRAAKTPNTIDTNFRVGSVTKQFTATAILVLQQDGKLSVDDPISKYLPDYPAVGRSITLHQLLTHTSGIPSYTELPGVMDAKAKPHTPKELLALFWDKPLDFAPGSQWAYSNSNYIVLGAIIEKVSGMSYTDFCAKRLFAPAGLTRTVVGDADGMSDRGLGYQPDGDDLVAADAIDMSVPYAAGAVRSTAGDLVKWAHALDGDSILTADSKARMYKVEKNNYAYGWVVTEQEGHRIIGHDGGIDGFETMYLRVPDQDLVVVEWTNNTGIHIPIGEAALAVALGGDVQPVVEPDLVPLDEAAAARTIGHYTLTDAAKQAAQAQGLPPDVLAQIVSLDITRTGARLFMKPVGQDSVPLDALSATKYLQIDAAIQVDVTLPDAGPATLVTITQGPMAMPYARDDAKPAAPAKPTKSAKPAKPHK